MPSVYESVPEVSIVVPVYNEFDNLPALVERIHAAMQTQPLSYELIAVDDGSNDSSAMRLRELTTIPGYVLWCRSYPGSRARYRPGFDRVRGRYVVTLDMTCRDEPGDIPLLLQSAWRATPMWT